MSLIGNYNIVSHLITSHIYHRYILLQISANGKVSVDRSIGSYKIKYNASSTAYYKHVSHCLRYDFQKYYLNDGEYIQFNY